MNNNYTCIYKNEIPNELNVFEQQILYYLPQTGV